MRESRIDEVASAAQAVQMSVTVRDQRGIGTITPVKQDNATLDIPPFQPGDTEVVVTATKIDAKKRAFVQLQVCPPGSCGCAGCCGLIDPVVAELRIPAGRGRVRESFSDIPVFEHLLVVQNGSPGLRSVRINVNGRWVGWLHLGPDEIQTVDLEPYMLQAANVVTLIGAGAPGSSALALISDLPAAGDGAGTAVLPSRVRWQPATQQADLDLHWGH
ncbi:MAG TPA: hypothetical protein VKM72_04160 [Thermoanaerobaculia bacterium]|nr:hypothetical protein [Thermoanaerobaculia bacterium]